MKYPFIRILKITLTNKQGKRITIGGDSQHLSIECKVYKYLSTMKDSATVRIKNLTYTEIVEIIDGGYYDVDIECGYRNRGTHKIFSGGVLYISNSLGDRKTNEVIILCSSKLIARFGQARLNLTLNSGINLYSAIRYTLRRAGINNFNISSDLESTLKKANLQDYFSITNSTVQEFLQTTSREYGNIIAGVNVDNSNNSIVSILSAKWENARHIKIDNDKILIAGGYPKMTSKGVNLSVVPTYPFMPGDVIVLDNSIIDISVSQQSDIYKLYGLKISEKGEYRIKELSYNLTNRGNDFSVNIDTYSRTVAERESKPFRGTGATRSF